MTTPQMIEFKILRLKTQTGLYLGEAPRKRITWRVHWVHDRGARADNKA